MKWLLWLGFSARLLAAEALVIPEYREAELGNAAAQVKVGTYYVNMYAKTKIGDNLTEAADWFNKAAKQKNPEAMYNLAKLYGRPEPEVHNTAESFHWWDELYDRNQIATGCNFELCRMYATGTYAEPAGKPDFFKAYYHLLLQRAAGIEPSECRTYENLALKQLSPSQIKDAKDRAFRWIEDHNKPRFKLEDELNARNNGGNGNNNKSNNDNNDTRPTAKEQAVDTSDKALALAQKNAQENARLVNPLGKSKKYQLPGSDQDSNSKYQLPGSDQDSNKK